MKLRYWIAATPAIGAIAIGWIMPLIVYGSPAFMADGGGRVLDNYGVCCIEPTPFVIAKYVFFYSPLIFAASALAMLAIKVLSKRR
jgi:hypothetical protein